MADPRLEQFETKMNKTFANLEGEFQAIRAGRANPHVLDKIKVDYYGTPTPIQQVGNVSVPEARIIHYFLKKVKESRGRSTTVAKKKWSSNRGIQKPNQVIFNTIQLVFMYRCFLVCSCAPICTES